MVFLPFSSVYIRENGLYAVQVPRDVQQVFENDDFRKLDSHVGKLTDAITELPDVSTLYIAAYLCPHQGVAKGWPPCTKRKEPDELTKILRETAVFLSTHIPSPYAKCLSLPPPCKNV